MKVNPPSITAVHSSARSKRGLVQLFQMFTVTVCMQASYSGACRNATVSTKQPLCAEGGVVEHKAEAFQELLMNLSAG